MNKRRITYRVLIDGVVTKIDTEMRQVYTDSQGEYIKSMGNKYYLVNDSYDINHYSGRGIQLKNQLKNCLGV